MGCDFWWSASLPDASDQIEAVDMFRRMFDYSGCWPVIRPFPDQAYPTLFSTSITADPIADKSVRGRIQASYPENYWGSAPYRRPGETSENMRQGQLVFDRSDGGRIVSVLRTELLGNCHDLQLDRASNVLIPGGYLCLQEKKQCISIAIFLALLRLRLCPDMEAHDECGYIESVTAALERSGQVAEMQEESPAYGKIALDFLEAHPSASGTSGNIDFLPVAIAWVILSGRINPEDSEARRRHLLAVIRSVLLRSQTEFTKDTRPFQALIGLGTAVTEAWRRDGFCCIVNTAQGEGDTLEIHHSLGGHVHEDDIEIADIVAQSRPRDDLKR